MTTYHVRRAHSLSARAGSSRRAHESRDRMCSKSTSSGRRNYKASTSRGRRRWLARERSGSADSGCRARSMSTARDGVGAHGASQRSTSVHGDGARGRSRGAPKPKALFKECDRVQDQDEDSGSESNYFDKYKNAHVEYSTEEVASDKLTRALLFLANSTKRKATGQSPVVLTVWRNDDSYS